MAKTRCVGQSTGYTKLPVSYSRPHMLLHVKPVADLHDAGIDKSGSHGSYKIEYKENRQVVDDRALLCKYGKLERLFRIADVSNGDFEEVRLLLLMHRLTLILGAERV